MTIAAAQFSGCRLNASSATLAVSARLARRGGSPPESADPAVPLAKNIFLGIKTF
jgi:hypothetical protein